MRRLWFGVVLIVCLGLGLWSCGGETGSDRKSREETSASATGGKLPSGAGEAPSAENAVANEDAPDLRAAIKQAFNVDEGLNEKSKQFIAFIDLDYPGKKRVLALRHENRIEVPDEEIALHGAVQALGEFCKFINQDIEITEESGKRVRRTTAVMKAGELQITVKGCVTMTRTSPKDVCTEKTVILHGGEVLASSELGADGEMTFKHDAKIPDLERFCALLTYNGLRVTLLGWATKEESIEMAYAIRILEKP